MKILVNTAAEKFTHEYDFVAKKNTFKLFRSHGSDWSEHARGELAAKLKDDGNGVQIHLENNNIYLNYPELQELQLLLSLIEKPNYKVI